MTSDRKSAANRTNAARSTGPITAAGKRASSRNATVHGLTTSPEQADVLRWYRIIRGDPIVEFPHLPMNDHERAALRLAEAEAQLERTRNEEAEHLVRLADCALRRGRRTIEDLVSMDSDEGLEDEDFLNLLIKNCRGDRELVGALRLLRRSSPNRPIALDRRMQVLRGYRQRAEGGAGEH